MTQCIEVKLDFAEKNLPIDACRELEKGNILLFPSVPFEMPDSDIQFLLKQRQTSSKRSKNIAYKPQSDKISNADLANPSDAVELKKILENYSFRVSTFLSKLLAPYVPYWQKDAVSFRPFQEKGRNLRLRARNDLLHVDAFPTRPTHGARILRFFTNINPQESRHWITSKPFTELVREFIGHNKLRLPASSRYSLGPKIKRILSLLIRSVGIKIPLRSPYDVFMLQLHNFLKENTEFQANCPKNYWHFPPGSCWAVFTDQVSHAAISGQYALEQTLLIPRHALLYPELSPISTLERLTNGNMIDLDYAQALNLTT